MKHPVKVFAIVIVALAAIAAVAIVAVKYMDVLQRQFESFRDMVARWRSRIPDCCDGDCCEELEDNLTDVADKVVSEASSFDADTLKF